MSLPDEMTRCPYNSYHILLKSRFSAHLCKCRRQYQGNDFTVCPFNTTHNILTPELQYHVENCPDRKILDCHLYVVDDPVDETEKSYKTVDNNITLPPSFEDWDNEPEASTSYLDVKEDVITKKAVLRIPSGKSRSQRKKFFVNEVRRFENISTPSCSYESTKDSDVSPTKSHVTKKSHQTEPLTTPSDEDSDEEYTVVRKEGQRRTEPHHFS